MARRTRLRDHIPDRALAAVAFDAVLSVSAVVLGVALLATGTRGLAERTTFPSLLIYLLGVGLLVTGIVGAITQVLQLPSRRLLRENQALIDAEVAAFAATLAGAEPFDITGRL